MDLNAELERLMRKNAVLEMRLRELSEAHEDLKDVVKDLKDVCAARGVCVEDALANEIKVMSDNQIK